MSKNEINKWGPLSERPQDRLLVHINLSVESRENQKTPHLKAVLLELNPES